ARCGRILDVGRRMPDAVEKPVDLAIAERRPVLVRLELGSEGEISHLPAHRGEKLLHRSERTRPRVADVETLALEIGERLDAGFFARNNGERLRVDREHGAQVAVGAGVL